MRMPYGVKLASGIFQRFIKNKLNNIPCTVGKIDDILTAGKKQWRTFKKDRKSIGNFEWSRCYSK